MIQPLNSSNRVIHPWLTLPKRPIYCSQEIPRGHHDHHGDMWRQHTAWGTKRVWIHMFCVNSPYLTIKLGGISTHQIPPGTTLEVISLITTLSRRMKKGPPNSLVKTMVCQRRKRSYILNNGLAFQQQLKIEAMQTRNNQWWCVHVENRLPKMWYHHPVAHGDENAC